MSDDTLWHQYEAAMRQWGTHPVVIESTILQMAMLIGPLQLALRHPLFPQHSKRYVQQFIQGFLDQVRTKDLAIAEVIERGNDPHYDVRPRRTRR